jgi:GTP-binding protein
MSSHYQKAHFLLSAAEVAQLPRDQGIEIALAGRSNAGKSSVLNCLTHNKNLARVSKTPGRTQAVNLFGLDDGRRIADLPGYGFAKVPLAVKQKWQKTVNAYIQGRSCLKGVVLVMDIRHPFKEGDIQLLEYCAYRGLSVHILLNKADKLGRVELAKTLQAVKHALTSSPNSVTFQMFSALQGQGVGELKALLDQWFEY